MHENIQEVTKVVSNVKMVGKVPCASIHLVNGQGIKIYLVIFLILKRETTLMTSHLLSWTQKPIRKGSLLWK